MANKRARKSGSAKRKAKGGGRSSSARTPAAAVPPVAPAIVPPGFTALQARFLEEYLVDRNAADAYRRATDNKRGKSARERGYQLLHLPHVQARLSELAAEQSVDAERRKTLRLGTLQRVMLDADEKTADRLRAVEVGARMDGQFVDKVEHSGKVALEDILAASWAKPESPAGTAGSGVPVVPVVAP